MQKGFFSEKMWGKKASIYGQNQRVPKVSIIERYWTLLTKGKSLGRNFN